MRRSNKDNIEFCLYKLVRNGLCGKHNKSIDDIPVGITINVEEFVKNFLSKYSQIITD